MKTVAELVKQRFGIIEAEQGRLACSRIAADKIIVVDDDRRHRLVHVLLVAISAGPRARSLAGASEIVVQKKADMTAGFVANFPDPHIGMIDGEILAFGEGHPEQAAGCAECRLNHVVEHEIWLRFSLVEIVLGLTDLLRVVPPVPWLDRLVETFGASHCLDRRQLRPRPGRSEEHTSELQSRTQLVCRLLLENKKTYRRTPFKKSVTSNFSLRHLH